MRLHVIVLAGVLLAALTGCDERRVLLDNLPRPQYTCDGPEEFIPGLGPCARARPLRRPVVPGRAFWATIILQNNTTARWENVIAPWEPPESVYWAASYLIVDGVKQAIRSREIMLQLGDMPSRAKREVRARLRVGTKPPALPRTARVVSALSPEELQRLQSDPGLGFVPLDAGWNLMAVPHRCTIGHLYIVHGGADILPIREAAYAGWVAPPLWGYSGGSYKAAWAETDYVHPLKGYWLLAAPDCQLVVLDMPPPPPAFGRLP